MYITFGSNKHHVDPILNYRQTCNGLKSVFFESFVCTPGRRALTWQIFFFSLVGAFGDLGDEAFV